MKIFKEIFYLIANILSKPFYFLASLGSLVGFFIVFINDTNKILLSFVFFNFLLLALISTLIYTVLKLLNNASKDFESRSTFIKYETSEDRKSVV